MKPCMSSCFFFICFVTSFLIICFPFLSFGAVEPLFYCFFFTHAQMCICLYYTRLWSVVGSRTNCSLSCCIRTRTPVCMCVWFYAWIFLSDLFINVQRRQLVQGAHRPHMHSEHIHRTFILLITMRNTKRKFKKITSPFCCFFFFVRNSFVWEKICVRSAKPYKYNYTKNFYTKQPKITRTIKTWHSPTKVNVLCVFTIGFFSI